MPPLDDLNTGQMKEKILELARQGDISSANINIGIFRSKRKYTLTMGSELFLLERKAYREYIEFCFDSAESELDSGQLKLAEEYLDLAKKHSLELGDCVAGVNLWRKHPPLYGRLETLKEEAKA